MPEWAKEFGMSNAMQSPKQSDGNDKVVWGMIVTSGLVGLAICAFIVLLVLTGDSLWLLLGFGSVVTLRFVVFAGFFSVPRVHFGVVTFLNKRQPEVLKEGLHWRVPYFTKVELVEQEVVNTVLNANRGGKVIVTSRDKFQIEIIGSIQQRPNAKVGDRNGFPRFIEMDETVINEGISDAVEDVLGAIAGVHDARTFISKREGLALIVRSTLQLSPLRVPHQDLRECLKLIGKKKSDEGRVGLSPKKDAPRRKDPEILEDLARFADKICTGFKEAPEKQLEEKKDNKEKEVDSELEDIRTEEELWCEEVRVLAGRKADKAVDGESPTLSEEDELLDALDRVPAVPSSLRLAFYTHFHRRVKQYLADASRRPSENEDELSEIELRFGIDIIAFNLASVDFPPDVRNSQQAKSKVDLESTAVEVLIAHGVKATDAWMIVRGVAKGQIFSLAGQSGDIVQEVISQFTGKFTGKKG
ncbi:MAG: hypothetical protein COU10_04200 [Candidatus Harrisonbacteria bacterium CG10_big_fil_rev_8_21_14_0_10_45_28]|uniref:Band 7 domain-containing protein n=1 Tax=Candidatus Harrisonbacteria bacterium CG10_big_fil_rev_8_21_14_0_10_45_28 TaxID=1974586 RepID=A0A2H0UM72_9BACT|nr:MAG: hypothetical protein COU10_04200 [Candidatus Harrisonbacteria bacterium CG10_big_fil_rev_8_21_14_0_10_45_28]